MTSFGIIFHPRFPPEILMDYARRAEDAGFSELWLWDDCFLPGAFTSASIALAATKQLKVGIGLVPATVYNPLFATMEITSLARAFPGRFMPGFGYGVDVWMKQIGAAPLSSMKTLEETVFVIRSLLRGEQLNVHEHGIHLDEIQMEMIPQHQPPLYIGAMREKTLQLAGRIADGTILTSMSSPAYIQWAKQQISIGIEKRPPEIQKHRIVTYVQAKVSQDGKAARDIMRQSFADQFLSWADIHLNVLGIYDEAHALYQKYGGEMAQQIPEAWLDVMSASGTPEQAASSIKNLAEAGTDAIILQPLGNDPASLDEYIRYLMPLLS
jgi:5,10-methylenetetrahydromethanopterin reductase